MKILIVGGGGREHALAWKLSDSDIVDKVYCWPSTPGAGSSAATLGLSNDASYLEVINSAKSHAIDFVVVGPEKPLAEGFANLCAENKLPVFGPDKNGAMLEASKSFAKEVMTKAKIPTAAFKVVRNEDSCRAEALAMLKNSQGVVLKASGLAGGKGVFVCFDKQQVEDGLARLYHSNMRSAADEIVVEEVLKGRECSFFAFLGEGSATPIGFAVDFKRLKDGDMGPNTGGMGCYTPVPWLPDSAAAEVMNAVVQPLVSELREQGIEYRGCLYVGLMWGSEGPAVVEFNVRLGDPEAQALAVADKRDWAKMIASKLGLFPEVDAEGQSHEPSPTVCVVMASGAYPYGEGSETHPDLPSDLFKAADDAVTFGASVTLSDSGAYRVGSGRILAVVSKGRHFSEARSHAYSRVTKLTGAWEDAQFRKDIANRISEEENK